MASNLGCSTAGTILFRANKDCFDTKAITAAVQVYLYILHLYVYH